MSIKTAASSAADPIVTALQSVPKKYRKLAYTTLAIVISGLGIWQAAEGNWGIFALGILSAVTHAMSRVNTGKADTTYNVVLPDNFQEIINREISRISGGTPSEDEPTALAWEPEEIPQPPSATDVLGDDYPENK